MFKLSYKRWFFD